VNSNSKSKHRARHIELHHAFEELVEDWRYHTQPSRGKGLGEGTVWARAVRELWNWSQRQCIEPDAVTEEELE